MVEIPTFVEAGTRIYADSGQFLEVTDWTAVGMHGRLYQTHAWAERSAKNKADWDGRSWWRKLWNMPPRGHPTETMAPLFPNWIGLPFD